MSQRMIALKDNDNTARKLEVSRVIVAMLATYYSRGVVDDITMIVSSHGKPVKIVTTLTAEECLGVLSEAADDAIENGGV